MTWGSWENFLAMGGYAPYVWGSYLVALALMIAEIALLALRKRSAIENVRGRDSAPQGKR